MAVSAFSIVEHFDVIEDIGASHFACLVDPFLDPLFLQTAKERLDDGIVPAVAPPAHAGLKVMLAAEPKPVIAAVLRSLVGMDDDLLLGFPSPDSHQDRVDNELLGQGRLHGPADDLAGEQVHDDGEVQPALPGADVGDVRHPGAIRMIDRKLTLQPVGGDDRGSPVDPTRDLVAVSGFDFIGFHDASHSVFATSLSDLAQVQVYPTIAIDTPTGRVRGTDQYQQPLILDGAIR